MELTLQHFLVVSALIFCVGVVGAVVRRNLLIIFMSIELMMGAAILALLAFSRFNLLPAGKAAALIIIAVVAATSAVGLAIVVALYRQRHTTDSDDLHQLKG